MENTEKRIYPDIENLARLDLRLARLVSLMEDRFELFGYRFGINFLIELIPGIGDVIAPMLGLYVFNLAAKYNASKWTKFRMLLNLVIYFFAGLIPGVGDIFGAWFKPNRRNLKLLQKKISFG